MLRPAEFAFRDDDVHAVERTVEHPGGAPELRRAPVAQLAAQAGAGIAKLAPMPPEDMGRTDEPMLMRLIDLQALAHRQEARQAAITLDRPRSETSV